MQQCPGGTLYVVKPGDTLWAIARVRNLSLDAIIGANPGLDPDNLRVGQAICLPVPSPARCGPGLVPYTIQPGDTLYSLQQRGIISSLQQTLRDNPNLDPANLRIGQIICVPGAPGPAPAPGVCPQPSRQYVVQPGDTFFSIAQRFGVSVARIEGANQAVNPNNLQVGQVICIPGL